MDGITDYHLVHGPCALERSVPKMLVMSPYAPLLIGRPRRHQDTKLQQNDANAMLFTKKPAAWEKQRERGNKNKHQS